VEAASDGNVSSESRPSSSGHSVVTEAAEYLYNIQVCETHLECTEHLLV